MRNFFALITLQTIIVQKVIGETVSSLTNTQCIVQNCLFCDQESQKCRECKTPFTLNLLGLCDSSLICKPNQFYLQENNCLQSCPNNMKENNVLNICEQVNNCSSSQTIGKNYIPGYYNQIFMVYDSDSQIYIQVSVSGLINLFDSTNLQFQVQLETSMKVITNTFYDYISKYLILTNKQGEVEVWDIIQVYQKSYTKVNNYESTKVIYLNEINKLIYINPSKNLTIIEINSSIIKILPYQLISIDFNAVFIKQINQIIIAGIYWDTLQITADDKYSVIFSNLNQVQPTSQLTSIVIENFIFLVNLKNLNQVQMYNPFIQAIISSNDLNLSKLGIFMNKLFSTQNETLQFYEWNQQNQFIKLGFPYAISLTAIISYDNYTKAIGYKINESPDIDHISFDLDISNNKVFSDQMITNITKFKVYASIMTTPQIDEINRRMLLQGKDGSFHILNIDTLQIVYKFRQFQSPPYLFNFKSIRQSTILSSDIINEPYLFIATIYSIQSINVFNGKVNKRQKFSDMTIINQFLTKDFIVSKNENKYKFQVLKQSNLQKVDNIIYPIRQIFNKTCDQTYKLKSGNDFIAVCSPDVSLYSYIFENQTYSIQLLFRLKSTKPKIGDSNDHLIVCYDVECFYHLKTKPDVGKMFISGKVQINQIFISSDQIFFIIIANSSQTGIFYSYPGFQILKTYTLPEMCFEGIQYQYFEKNKIFLSCNSNSQKYNPYILFTQLTTEPEVGITCKTLKMERKIYELNFIDNKTILIQQQQVTKLYFYIYEFALNYTKVIEKAQNIIEVNFSESNYYFYLGIDLYYRRIYFDIEIVVSKLAFQFSEVQVCSFQYEKQYYSLVDEKDRSEIIKLKRCVYNQNVVGILRKGSIYIEDLMQNKSYKIMKQNVTDIYIDSSINVLFYLLNQSQTLYSFDYLSNQLIFEYTLEDLVSDFSEFIQPIFPKSFILFNKVNSTIFFCQYDHFPQKACTYIKITNSTKIVIFDKITSYKDIAFIYSQYTYYHLKIYSTDYFVIQQLNSQTVNLFTNTGFIFSQNPSSLVAQKPTDGAISDKNMENQLQLKINCFVTDMIIVDVNYIFICYQSIIKLNKSFIIEQQFSLSVSIKKALYYKNNIVVFISSDQNSQQFIYSYNMQTQIQQESIKIGVYPLENILYMDDEDLFIVYNIQAQVFRIDLKNDLGEQIVNTFEVESNFLKKDFIPQIYINKVLNKIYITIQDQIYLWNYSPFIGERMNFSKIRLKYYAVQDQINQDIIYYSDISGNLWSFYFNKQSFIGKLPYNIIDMYVEEEFLVGFFMNYIQIYSSGILLNQINITENIQLTIKFKLSIFAFINDKLELFILDISNNPQASPIKFEQQLPSTPKDIILVSDDTIIISIQNQSPLKYKLNDSQFQILQGVPNLQGFIGSKTIPNENKIIIIEQKNIVKLDNKSFFQINYLNFPEMDSSGYIESFEFDMDQKLLLIHYTQQSYVFIISFDLAKENIKRIGCCDIYKEYIVIYCQFQINFHSRNPELSYQYQFRNPVFIKSIFNLIILNDIYLVAAQSNIISIFNMSTLIQNNRSFTLMRTIQSTQPTIFQCFLNEQNQIKIQGVGYEGSFNYNLSENNPCQSKFTQINNILSLRSQLYQFKLAEFNQKNKYYYLDIELDSNKIFTKLPYIDSLKFFKNNNVLMTYIPKNQNQQLVLNNGIFQDIQLNELILKDFNFVLTQDSDNITFNPQTKSVFFKQIVISDDLVNISFKFTNLQKVIISNLKITDLNVINSTIFLFNSVKQIYLANITLENVNFTNSTLISVNDSQDIIFNDIYMKNVNFLQKQNRIISVSNSIYFELNKFKINSIIKNHINSKVSNNDVVYERDNDYLQLQLNHIIHLQKINKIHIEEGECENLKNISMIKVDKFFLDNFVMQTLYNSEILIKSIMFRNNNPINSIVYISASYLYLDNITGIQNSCLDCNGSVLTLYETSKLTLQNSYFIQNSAIHGGSISHIKCNDHQNYIFNTTFTSNSARDNGGAIYLEKCNLKLNNSNFSENIALIGGAIRYKDFVPIFISEYRNSTNNLKFIDNKGEIYGNNYGSYFGQIMIQDVESQIKEEKQVNQNNLEKLFIREFSSGDYIQFYIELFDEERKKIKFNPKNILSSEIPESIRNELQKIIISLESQEDDILIEGSNIATFKEFEEYTQRFQFPKIRLISQPTKEGTLLIKTNNDFEIPFYLFDQNKTTRLLENDDNNVGSNKDYQSQIIKNQITIKIKINFRECQRGEIYLKMSQTKTSCYKCPLGTYSIVQPDYNIKQECIQCSSYNTKECGNNTIILADGFWRLNEFSDKIVQCTNRKENCRDTQNSIDYCSDGLIGPLCELCDTQGIISI